MKRKDIWGIPRADLTGKRFGKLTVRGLAKDRHPKNGMIQWLCACDCGKTTKVVTAMLNNGHTQSCGCTNKPPLLTGKRFGRWTVLGLSKKRSEDGRRIKWRCVCDCGTKGLVETAPLTRGTSQSCGCLVRDKNTGGSNYQVQRLKEKYGDYLSVKDPWHVRASSIMYRCKKEGIKTDFDHPLPLALYLKSIDPKICPVFNKPLTTGIGKAHKYSPSVDKIDPAKGYTCNNMQVISLFANKIKNRATPKQLFMFAVWRKGLRHEAHH